MNTDELYDGLVEFYGVENQIVIAVEELSELQKELCKLLRGTKKITAISEEMADVEIVLEQLKRYFKNHEIVKQIKVSKLNRTVERLNTSRLKAAKEEVLNESK